MNRLNPSWPRWLSLLMVLLLLTASACQPKPRAPALDNSPIYVNRQEGFELLVPEGWFQQSKTELPPGPLDKERTLVLYRSLKPTPASLDISCRDLSEDTDIGDFLAQRKRSGSGWTRIKPPEQVQYGGKSGTRYTLKGKPAGKSTIAEIVVFRRGERVYFFGGYYSEGDTLRRTQLRQFLDGLTWTKP